MKKHTTKKAIVIKSIKMPVVAMTCKKPSNCH